MHGERVPVDLVRETDDPILREVFDRLAQKPTGIVNIHRTLGNSPEVFSAFIGLTVLERRLKSIRDRPGGRPDASRWATAQSGRRTDAASSKCSQPLTPPNRS